MKTSQQFNSYPTSNDSTTNTDRSHSANRILEFAKDHPFVISSLGVIATAGTLYAANSSPEAAPQPTAREIIESDNFEELGMEGIVQLENAKAIIRRGTDGVPHIDFTVKEGSTLVDAATEAVKSHSAETAEMTVLQNEEIIYTAQKLNEELGNVTPAGYEATAYVADFVDNDGKLDIIVDRRPVANE